MAKNVVGLFDTSQDAQATVRDLRDAGFSERDIEFLANNASGEYGTDTTADDTRSEAPEGAGFGATGGAVLGGLAGLLLGLGVFALPGIGLVAGAGTLLGTIGTTALGAGIGAAAGGLVGALVGAGIPEEDAHVYAEGVRRGGTLVSVQAEDDQVDTAVDIMQRHNVIDIDERATQYRSSGWTRFDENAEPYDRGTDASYSTASTGDADTGIGGDDYDRSSKVGTAGGGLAGAATGAAIGSAGGPVGTVIGGVAGALTGAGVGAAGDAAGAEATDDDADRMSTTGATGVTGGTSYGSTTDVSSTAGYTTGTTGTNVNAGEEVRVPIIEEELRVGKREVQRGGVRIFTRVQEVPVNEQVTVRDETVRVERRPASGATTGIDATTAFQEATYEVRETDEEVVTDKQARVVEEVEIRKTAEERTETIQDSVRRTDVEVEEVGGTTRATGYTETTGTTGYTDTSATGTTGNDSLTDKIERGTGLDIDRDSDVGGQPKR